MAFKAIICIDFDGVLHSYSSGWMGADVAVDPPVSGAIEWLEKLIDDERFTPVIYSSRSRQEGGVGCMRSWLIRYGLPAEKAASLEMPTQKPAAFLTIDDRAICFDGNFPSKDNMLGFQPWNKKVV